MPRKLVLVTKTCKFCNADFEVPYGKRHRVFCGKSCASKGMVRKESVKSTSNCITCEKEFKHYGERICCSIDCNAKYMSKMRLGENNPFFKKDKDINFQCKHCKGSFLYQSGGHDKPKQFCSRLCWFNFQKGKNRELSGPSVFATPYPVEFKSAKKAVRKRDGNQCVMCGDGGERPSVHHIDYDKKNCKYGNLICLCKSCHGLTNYQRSFWEMFFTAIMSGSKLVRKEWGAEVHIANNPDYCLKYLVFFEGTHFSHHYHEDKKELWHCLMGEFEMLLESSDGQEQELSILSKGEKVQIERGVVHQLRAVKNSIIVEVSTESYAEDSFKDKNVIPEG